MHAGHQATGSQPAADKCPRRAFLARAVSAAGAACLAPRLLAAASTPQVRTAADLVPLGDTGLQISRIGFGTGSVGGSVQRALGQGAFNDLIRYGFERGITYIDAAQTYATFEWIAGAIQGLPREKLFLQSKIPGQPEDVLQAIDHHRQVFGTDYIDSLLIHCMVQDGWTDAMRRVMDGFEEAKRRQWIRVQGVSCHSLPALRTAVASDWPDVHLVRVNPQGKQIDGPEEASDKPGHDIAPVVEQLQLMRAKGRGVIGMKLIGEGAFVDPEDRQRSLQFAMSHNAINSVVIGFKSRQEIDEAMQRVDRALASP